MDVSFQGLFEQLASIGLQAPDPGWADRMMPELLEILKSDGLQTALCPHCGVQYPLSGQSSLSPRDAQFSKHQ
jgi:hypothetical protein